MQTSVLLVEQNDDVAGVVGRALARFVHAGFQITRAASAEDAKDELQQRHFDAVLVEVGDEVELDGRGLARLNEIRAHAGDSAFIALTSVKHEAVGSRVVELGVAEYVVSADGDEQTLALTVAYASERQRRAGDEKELGAALSSTVDAVVALDSNGYCLEINPAFETLLGHLAADVLRSPLLDLVQAADRQRVTNALATTTREDLDVSVVRKDGRIVPVQLCIVARPRGRGHFCFIRDLTGQKQVEGKLASAAAITAVGSLASGLAHEINNPLAVVLANVEEAVRVTTELEPSVTEAAQSELGELRAMLEEALSAAQRVQFIVRDLRAFAYADERRVRVEINAVVESCCNIAFAEIRHRAKLAKDLGAVVPVFGSEAKLAQVFLNLLVNAAHAMPEGDVERNEIRISTRQQGRSAIEIEVSDTGSGISTANAKQVFEPFFTTKPRRPGMGLAIAKATVHAHGGEISVRPREGGGTVVRVVLPTLEVDTSEETSTSADGGPQRRVLVVDDDPLVLRSLTRLLARDFEVASARNGREALELVRAGGYFDALLCDLIMPELSGIELHDLLAQDDPELAKRTVFLTGDAFNGQAKTFLDRVGLPHLEKPVDPKTVRDLLLDLSRTPHRERTGGKWLGGG
jgi:PAS domain S-box-containing protein